MTLGDDTQNNYIDCHGDCMLKDTVVRPATPELFAMTLLTFLEERLQHEDLTALLFIWSRVVRKNTALLPLLKVKLDVDTPIKTNPA